ncbi:MAG: nuclear transport factor 2 family protein [Sandaracinaceae bacterium]|nr:nuclear transport factor 2 family protein [Sandaracinaceae bacterium]
MQPPLDQLMEVVEASPAMVAAQDRAGWVSLFAPDGIIEDPVGAGPHLRAGPGGEDQLGLFWDTFIAGTDIRFEVARDGRHDLAIGRDVTIHTRFASGFTLQVPAYVIYELDEGADGLLVTRLAAHWSLRRMVVKVLLGGPLAWWSMTLLSLRLLANQRLRGILGYLKALTRGVFGRGEAAAVALGRAVAAKDEAALGALLADTSPAREALVDLAQLRVSNPIACGQTVAARIDFAREGEPQTGVALFTFDDDRRIRTATLFVAEADASRT